MSKVTIEDVCRSAWESTRPEAAVTYDELSADYRAKLTERAEGVLSGIYPAEPWVAFETQVCQLADGRGNMQVGSELPEYEDAPDEEEAEEDKDHESDDAPTRAKKVAKRAAKKAAPKKTIKVVKKSEPKLVAKKK